MAKCTNDARDNLMKELEHVLSEHELCQACKAAVVTGVLGKMFMDCYRECGHDPGMKIFGEMVMSMGNAVHMVTGLPR